MNYGVDFGEDLSDKHTYLESASAGELKTTEVR